MHYLNEFKTLLNTHIHKEKGTDSYLEVVLNRIKYLPDSNKLSILDATKEMFRNVNEMSIQDVVAKWRSEGLLDIKPRVINAVYKDTLMLAWDRYIIFTDDMFYLFDAVNDNVYPNVYSSVFNHSDIISLFHDIPDSVLLYDLILCNLFTMKDVLSYCVDARYGIDSTVLSWFDDYLNDHGIAACGTSSMLDNFLSVGTVRWLPDKPLIYFGDDISGKVFVYYDEYSIEVYSKDKDSLLKYYKFEIPDINCGVRVEEQVHVRQLNDVLEKRCYKVLPFIYMLVQLAGIMIDDKQFITLRELEDIELPKNTKLTKYDGTVKSLEIMFL